MTAILRSFNQWHDGWRYSWYGVFVHAVYEPALIVFGLVNLYYQWDCMSTWNRAFFIVCAAGVLACFVKTVNCFRYRLDEYAERCDLAQDYWDTMIQLQDELAELRGEEPSTVDTNTDAT
ncbi:hypothetical protein C5E45_29325 [Nocardia nova]|uniref:Uncharacterized protein n=1 Tax=Nocardia nova TaxID=37330 RepID=A0A2S6AHQ0_9NOCA|nr:hypothetical protein [Nocardia nova]PPJ23139.1 hypothetical protein C5E41_25455 [Nocardia nova]PPJ34749.1 hypothetical protein C5E45_29325 [Nocardia nova]